MKTSKSFASILALLLLTVCMVIGIASCNKACQHQWKDATCTTPKTCSLCQATEGEALGHSGGNATCSQKAVCSVCNTEYGDFAAHAYTENTVKDAALKSAANCSSAAIYYKSCACGAVSTNAADTFMDGRIGKHQYGNTTVCTICGFDAGDSYYYNFAESFVTTESGSIIIKDFVYEVETNDTAPTDIQKINSINFAELELFNDDGKLGGNAHGKICITYFGAVTKYYEAFATISDNYAYISIKDECNQTQMVKYSVEELVNEYLENRFYRSAEETREILSFINDNVFPVIEILAENSQSDLNKLLDRTLNAVFTFEKQADGSVVVKPDKDKIVLLNNTLAEKTVAEVIDTYYGEGAFNGLIDFAYEILDLKVSEIPDFAEENGIDYDDFVAKLQAFTHKIGNPAEGEEGYINIDEQIKNSEYSDSILADLVFPSLPEECDTYKEALEEYLLTNLREKSLYEINDYSEEDRTNFNDNISELFKYINISITTNAAGEFTNIHLGTNKMPCGGSSHNGITYDPYVSFSLDVIAGGTINVTWGNLVDEFNKESAPIPESEKEEFSFDHYTYGSTDIYFDGQNYRCNEYYQMYVNKADFSSPIGEQFSKNCGNWNYYSTLFNGERYYCYVYFVKDNQNVFFLANNGYRAKLTQTATGFSVMYEDGTTKELVATIDGTPTKEQLAKLAPEVFADYYFYSYDNTQNIVYYYNTQTKEYATEDQHNWSYSYEMFGDDCYDGYKYTKTCSKCSATVVDYSSYHDTEETRVEFADHGMCGGYIEIRKCRACNYAYINKSDYCYWNYQETDDNGYSVYKCASCNAVRKTKNVETEKDENCQYTRTEEYIYIVDGKEIFNGASFETYTSHAYEYTYELIGATCDDGYKVTYTCTDCGYSNSRESFGHDTEWTQIYFEELGMCGGYVYEYRCQVCNTVTNISSVDDYACNWQSQGEIDGYSVYKCSECNAIKKTKTSTTEKDENCNYEETIEYIFFVNGKEVYKGIDNNYHYREHNFNYSYEMFGATCDDGYRVTYTCTDCGYSNTDTSYSHNTEYEYIYFNELGMCGGSVEESRCQICDTVTNIWLNDYSCSWVWQYDAADGYSIYKCSYCKAIKKEKNTTTEKDNNCSYKEITEYIYIVNSKEVYKGQKTYNYTDHAYNYSYEMFGATCDDGYRVMYTCTDCGYSDYYTSSGHNYGDRYSINLGDLGTCGGDIREYCCQICNAKEIAYVNDYCDWGVSSVDANGYSTCTCNSCNAVKKMIITYTSKDENCNYEETIEWIYIVNGTEVYNGSQHAYYVQAHNYEYSYEMFGATCGDGYRVIETCTDCGYSDYYTSFGHDTEYEDIYFDEYPICGGIIREEHCNICGMTTGIALHPWVCEFRLLSSTDKTNTYYCAECGLIMTETWADNGNTYTLVLLKDGEEIYRGSTTA